MNLNTLCKLHKALHNIGTNWRTDRLTDGRKKRIHKKYKKYKVENYFKLFQYYCNLQKPILKIDLFAIVPNFYDKINTYNDNTVGCLINTYIAEMCCVVLQEKGRRIIRT